MTSLAGRTGTFQRGGAQDESNLLWVQKQGGRKSPAVLLSPDAHLGTAPSWGAGDLHASGGAAKPRRFKRNLGRCAIALPQESSPQSSFRRRSRPQLRR
jgi:hypothetical protein